MLPSAARRLETDEVEALAEAGDSKASWAASARYASAILARSSFGEGHPGGERSLVWIRAKR